MPLFFRSIPRLRCEKSPAAILRADRLLAAYRADRQAGEARAQLNAPSLCLRARWQRPQSGWTPQLGTDGSYHHRGHLPTVRA